MKTLFHFSMKAFYEFENYFLPISQCILLNGILIAKNFLLLGKLKKVVEDGTQGKGKGNGLHC